MSRTDHARKPKVWGHRTNIRVQRLFNGGQGYQAHCSCGQVGQIQERHAKAENDGYLHRREHGWAS